MRARILYAFLVLLLLCGSSKAQFTYATSTGTFPIASSVPSDWSAFYWTWSDQDYQQISTRFTGVTGATNIQFRLAYPEKGTYWLTIANPTITDDGTSVLTFATSSALAPSNIPPNKVYYAEFIMQGAGGVTRSLAKGRVKTDWSLFSLTNASTWTPITVVYFPTGVVDVASAIALSNETVNRVAADASLTNSMQATGLALTNESANRIAADAALSNSISGISVPSLAAISNSIDGLGVVVTNETANRVGADAALSNAIPSLVALSNAIPNLSELSNRTFAVTGTWQEGTTNDLQVLNGTNIVVTFKTNFTITASASDAGLGVVVTNLQGLVSTNDAARLAAQASITNRLNTIGVDIVLTEGTNNSASVSGTNIAITVRTNYSSASGSDAGLGIVVTNLQGLVTTNDAARLAAQAAITGDVFAIGVILTNDIAARLAAQAAITSDVFAVGLALTNETAARVGADAALTSTVTALAGYTNRAATALQAETDPLASPRQAAQLEPTGFADPSAVAISYDAANRQVTLTGTLSIWWRGTNITLTAPWVSPAHGTGTGTYYLAMRTSTNIEWSSDIWTFDMAQIATVNSNTAWSFCQRETHGLMPWQVHEHEHRNEGTYRKSGGQLVDGTYGIQPATPVDSSNKPNFAAASIQDEDCPTTIGTWTNTAYTKAWFTNAGTLVVNVAATNIFRKGTTYPIVNVWNGSAFVDAEAAGNNYLNVYQILVPATEDAATQRYRMLLLQPQVAYSSLAAAQAEDFRSLYLGNLIELSSELVAFARITLRTGASYGTTGKCRIESVAYLSGSKGSQVTITSLSSPTVASAITVATTPTNYSAGAANVEAHLIGIDGKLGASSSGAAQSPLTNNLNAANYGITGFARLAGNNALFTYDPTEGSTGLLKIRDVNSGDIPLRIYHAENNNAFEIYDNDFGSVNFAIDRYQQFVWTYDGILRVGSGRLLYLRSYGDAASRVYVDSVWGISGTSSSETGGVFKVRPSVVPSSGSQQFSALEIHPIINQSGSATGTNIGIDIRPTMASVLGKWLALKIMTGDVDMVRNNITNLGGIAFADGTVQTTAPSASGWTGGPVTGQSSFAQALAITNSANGVTGTATTITAGSPYTPGLVVQANSSTSTTPWEVTSISSLGAWYISTNGVTLTGTNVTQWADSSGKGANPLLAINTNSQPQYVASASNGFPALVFSGAATGNQCMTNRIVCQTMSNVVLMAAYKRSVANPANAYTIFGVSRKWMLAAGGASANNNGYYGGEATPFGAGGGRSNTVCIRTIIVTNGDINIYENGTWITNKVATAGDLLSGGMNIAVGARADGAYGFGEQIYEVAVFTNSVSTGDVAQAEGKMAWRYGVNTVLPVTHPYYASAPGVTVTAPSANSIVIVSAGATVASISPAGLISGNGAGLTNVPTTALAAGASVTGAVLEATNSAGQAIWRAKPMVSVYLSTNYNIPPNVLTDAPYNKTIVNDGGIYNTNTGIILPTVPGDYLFGGSHSIVQTAAATRAGVELLQCTAASTNVIMYSLDSYPVGVNTCVIPWSQAVRVPATGEWYKCQWLQEEATKTNYASGFLSFNSFWMIAR